MAMRRLISNLILSIVLSTLALGAIARVQKAGNKNDAASSLVVTLSTPTAGNTLFAIIATDQTTAGMVSGISSTGATWALQTSKANIDFNGTIEIWAAFNLTSSPSGTITITLTGTYSVCASAAEYSGIATSGAKDKTSGASGNTSAPAAGTTATTTQASELWLAGKAIVLTSVGYTPGSGWTNVDEQSNLTMDSEMDEKIVSSTGAAADVGSIALAAPWAGSIATFKAATAAASSTAIFFGGD